MAYTKRNFQKEQLLKADDLNAMDEQIAKNADNAENALSIAGNARDVADDARTVAGNANMTAQNAKSSADSAMARGDEAIRLAASAESLAKNVENQFQGAMTGKRYLEPTDHLDDIKDAGIYVLLSGGAPEGTPTNRSGVLVVFQFELGIAQVVYEIIDEKQSGMDINQFFRTSFNGAEAEWSKWWQDRTPEIVFTTGYRSDAVMSQEAVTGQLNLINQRVDGLSREPGEGDTVIGGVDPNVVRVFDSMLTNGVFVAEDANALKPTAIGGMNVETAPGTVMIEGLSRRDAKNTRTYNTSDTQRVEVLLYRLDKTTGEISRLSRDCIVHGGLIFSKKDGTDLPIRESGYYDILIWKITIPAGATEITQDMIEDLRGNESYCGYVRSSVSGGSGGSDGVKVDKTLTVSGAAADAAAVGTVIGNLRKETEARDIITEKRITNLEAGLPAERWSVDDSVAYVKDVPENALPFASVDMIGGMTRKCTNLLDVDGIDFENEIKTGEIHGKEVDAVYKENTQYCFTCRTTNKTEGLSGHILYLRVYYTDGTDNGYSPIANFTDNNTFKQLVTEKSKTVQRIVFQYAVSAIIAIDDAMLNEGTEPLPYEPYFEGLRSAPVTEVESVGVNLFDNIFTKQHIERGYFNDNAVFMDSSTTGHTELKMRVESDTQYTIHGNALVSQTGTWRVHRIYFYDRNKNWISRTSVIETESYTFRTPIDCAYIDVQIAMYNDIVDYSTININKGTTALPYTTYRRNTLPIPAEVQALDGYGVGTTDVGYNAIRWNDNGKCSYTQDVTRSVTIDGTEGGAKDTGYANTYIISKSVAFDGKEIRSVSYDVYPYNSASDIGLKNGVCVTENNIYITYERFTDDETIKNILLAHPIHLIASLAEPVITDLSDLLSADNLIGVEGGGTVTMVNEYGYDVPSEITYQLKGVEA